MPTKKKEVVMKNVQDVRFAREQLDAEVCAFLRSKGWKHTSSSTLPSTSFSHSQ